MVVPTKELTSESFSEVLEKCMLPCQGISAPLFYMLFNSVESMISFLQAFEEYVVKDHKNSIKSTMVYRNSYGIWNSWDLAKSSKNIGDISTGRILFTSRAAIILGLKENSTINLHGKIETLIYDEVLVERESPWPVDDNELGESCGDLNEFLNSFKIIRNEEQAL